MSDSTLKVTDKRMFTPEGELREEYRQAGEAPPTAASEVATADPAPTEAPVPGGSPAPASARASGPLGLEPDFFDLLAALAEPAALYLGESALADGTIRVDLELARVHIDLLAVLEEKTGGNLTPEEAAALEDVLYRLRMRYVQKRG